MKDYELKKSIQNGRFKKSTAYLSVIETDEKREQMLLAATRNLACSGNICAYAFARNSYFFDETMNFYINIKWILEIGMPHLKHSPRVNFALAVRQIELYPESYEAHYAIFDSNFAPSEINFSLEEELEFAQIMLRKWPNDKDMNFKVKIILESFEDCFPKLFIQKMAEMVAKDKRQAFKDLIIQGRFLESRLIRPDFFEHEIDTMLMEIARETYSICAYDYVWHWMRDMRRETAQKHLLMAEMTWFVGINTMSKETTHYDGTKELHFFHIYRAAELEPESIELQEKLLSLYEVDNESFDLDETKVLVDRVLQVSPESEQALRMQKILYSSK